MAAWTESSAGGGTLVEHAEHDEDDQQGAQDRNGLVPLHAREQAGVSLQGCWIEVGNVRIDTTRLMPVCAWLRLTPGASSNDTFSEAN